ncbi:hypothetical protein FPS10_09640 [Pseudoruegeria sp. M32A2M]|nr:hypothetical protein [Pseudoruegeria sp. M32A2M]
MPRFKCSGREAKNSEQGSHAERSASVRVADADAVQPLLSAEGREPREPDRDGSFEPELVKKGQTRIDGMAFWISPGERPAWAE